MSKANKEQVMYYQFSSASKNKRVEKETFIRIAEQYQHQRRTTNMMKIQVFSLISALLHFKRTNLYHCMVYMVL